MMAISPGLSGTRRHRATRSTPSPAKRRLTSRTSMDLPLAISRRTSKIQSSTRGCAGMAMSLIFMNPGPKAMSSACGLNHGTGNTGPVGVLTRAFPPELADEVCERSFSLMSMALLSRRTPRRSFSPQGLARLEQVAGAEAAWDAGLVTARHVEELDARSWAGTTEAQVSESLAELPLVRGISDVVRWCRDHDVVPALATLAWRPVGTYLCEVLDSMTAAGPRSRPAVASSPGSLWVLRRIWQEGLREGPGRAARPVARPMCGDRGQSLRPPSLRSSRPCDRL